jgi:hypothetical protein
MSGSDATVPKKRNRWVIGAFVTLAAVLIGMKCLCPDPAAAFRQQVTGSADVRGTPLRTAAAPTPAAPAAASTAVAAAPAEQAKPAAATVATAPAPVVAAAPTPQPTPVAAPRAAPPKSEPTAAKAAEAAPEDKTTVKAITWDDISKYKYVPPDPDADDASGAAASKNDKPKGDQIPEDIRAMSGKRFAIEGFVVPLDYEKGVATKFILLPAPLACCFAEAPPMNRWIMVSNDAKIEFDYEKYSLMRATGVFDVGEETREGYVICIYRMKAEKIENAKPKQ